MKVLIVGAGGQGGACASILARQDAIEEIRLVDLKEETAKAVADHIGVDKVKTGAVNATDPDDVARAAEGVDVVVDMVMPWSVKGKGQLYQYCLRRSVLGRVPRREIGGRADAVQGIQGSRTYGTVRMRLRSGND